MALKKELKSIQLLMLGGGVAASAGFFGLNLLRPALAEARRYQTEVAKFSTFGLGDAMNDQAVKFSKATKVIGASTTDMMAYLREAQGAFRESGNINPSDQFTGARIAAPVLARIHYAQAALGRGEVSEADDRAMLRFIEDRGATTDPRKFAATADMGYKLINSSGGQVRWQDLQSLIVRSAGLGRTISDDAIARLEPIVAAMGGGTTGSGLRTANQRLMGFQRLIPRMAVSEFLNLGLWDRKDIVFNSQGGVKEFRKPGEMLQNSVLESTDPVQWYTSNFLPALAKRYGNGVAFGQDARDLAKRQAEINMIFGGGSTGATVYTRIDQMLPIIQRSIEAQRKAMGINGSAGAADSTLMGKEIALQKNWQTLMLQTGEVILPAAIKALGGFNAMVQSISSFASAHPTAFAGLIGTFTAISGLLAVGGTISMVVGAVKAMGLAFRVLGGAAMAVRVVPLLLEGLAAGLEGAAAVLGGPAILIGAGIAAIGVAIYQIWKHWDSSKGVFANIQNELSMFWAFLKGLPGKLWDALPEGLRHAMSGAPSKPMAGPQGAPLGMHRDGYAPNAGDIPLKGGRIGPVSLHVDGHKLAEVVIPHMLGSPSQGGSSSFDMTMHPVVPGMGFGVA